MTLKTISPVDGRLLAERTTATPAEIDVALQRARAAQLTWRSVPLGERAAILERFCDEFEARGAGIAESLSWQMGRPLRYAPSEVRGTLERARHMIGIAATALADVDPGPKPGFRRFIRREPLGVVFTVAAWNYPYLIAVNSVVPALMAGNAVVLKHSAQTPLCAETFAECFAAAALPAGLFQVLHLEHAGTERVIRDPRIDFVAFTGSVAGGHAVQRAAAERFIGVGLELGGCDPVYVRHDADLPHAIENIVDGAYFNSGQSCCGLQRIYVHESVYQSFADGCIELIGKYRLGDPLDPETTLGPVVRTAAADAIRAQLRA
ncbi:MAG: aldehyde dehydrogenase family protein, partial [Steroidobacteraceae bacterium]|nr:aldehyde dehydrogenase family protein [Steroidobacteraceae bacterium]